MLRRLTFTVLAAASLASLSACKSDSTIRANLPTFSDTLVAYALTGTPATYPSALNSVNQTTVRIDGSAAFDIAFDLNEAGDVVLIPPRLLVSAAAGAASVGIQVLPATTVFDSITTAPTGTYRPDTATVVPVGQPFVILSTRNPGLSTVCYYVSEAHIYTKIVVDSVKPDGNRAIYFRQVVNPNCGYRSFLPGYPAN